MRPKDVKKQLRSYGARADGVDTNAVLAVFDRRRFRKPKNGMFAGDVWCRARRCESIPPTDEVFTIDPPESWATICRNSS
jgi:hypothetical protein